MALGRQTALRDLLICVPGMCLIGDGAGATGCFVASGVLAVRLLKCLPTEGSGCRTNSRAAGVLSVAWLVRGERPRCHQECPSRFPSTRKAQAMTLVVIGVDPHKGSHTAVAVDRDENELGSLKVRSSKKQCDMLMDWADRFSERRWVIESASGPGYLLAQQLVAAGEDVVDVPPTLSARVRVLDSTKASKTASPRRSVGGDRGVAASAAAHGGGR